MNKIDGGSSNIGADSGDQKKIPYGDGVTPGDGCKVIPTQGLTRGEAWED